MNNKTGLDPRETKNCDLAYGVWDIFESMTSQPQLEFVYKLATAMPQSSFIMLYLAE